MPEEKFSEITHDRIMRSVKVVKNRHYLYGLLSGLFLGLGLAGYVIYGKIIEQDSLDFLAVWWETLKIDFTLFADFGEEFKEFLPLNNIFIFLILLILVLIMAGIIFSFRKALFTKVDKFSKGKIEQNK